MSISLVEIFSSDSINILVEKVNKNFDQLALAGGGPIGPTGPTGIGIAGPQGRRGENFYWDDGSGLPSAPLVGNIIGDQFVLANGDVYQWDGVSWILTAVNIAGPIGPTGPSGASTELYRWMGGFGSSFGVSTSFYPQIPNIFTPTPAKSDYITFQRGGLDVMYLGDAEVAYGNLGPNTGISNWPLEANIGKLWVIQNALTGGGKNGIVLGAIGAKNTSDAISIAANYEQFGHIYLGVDGSMNIQMTAGGIADPKSINLLTDSAIHLYGGDVINNRLSIGLDSGDSLIGLYGNLLDKIELTTGFSKITTSGNATFEVDSDLDGIGSLEVKKSSVASSVPGNISAVSLDRTTGLSSFSDTAVYSDGFSIRIAPNKLSAVEMLQRQSDGTPYLSLGVTNNLNFSNKSLIITPESVALIAPKLAYPYVSNNAWYLWVNDSVNDSLPQGSLSVYGKIRMKDTGTSPSTGIVFGDSNGVFGYANSSGVPGNSTDFSLGLWSRHVAQSRIYLTTFSTDYVNLGSTSVDNGSLLHLRVQGSRNANITLENTTSTPPEVRFINNNFRTTLKSSSSSTADREFIIPKGADRGGTIMVFSDNNGQFDDSWEEYQKIALPAVPPGSVLAKNHIGLFAIGSANTITPDFFTELTNPSFVSKFVVSSGAESYPYGLGSIAERRYPSKVHLKRVNRDFWILSFAICLYIDPAQYAGMTQTNFNFFEFKFQNGAKPGVLKPMRDSVYPDDSKGGVWYTGAAYSTNAKSTGAAPSLPTINTEFRRTIVEDLTTYNNAIASFNVRFDMQWTTERLSNNTFRIQIMTAPILKQDLRNGIMFTGHAIMYGLKEASTYYASVYDTLGTTLLSVENP